MRVTFLKLAFAASCVFAGKALAVDEAGIKIADKWSVVGVISEDDEKGIVVLRNNSTKRTFTLAIGDTIPTEFGYVVKAAKNRSVVIANDHQQITLTFAEASTVGTDEDNGFSPTSRFLDNYYRGLSESPVEILGPATEGEPERLEQSGSMLPLKRFGSLREDGRSRFDLYRADRSYRASGSATENMEEGEEAVEQDEGEGEGGFVVNYDNFDDQPEDDSAGFAPPDEVPPMITE